MTWAWTGVRALAHIAPCLLAGSKSVVPIGYRGFESLSLSAIHSESRLSKAPPQRR
jgi:hypothetical protein